MRLASLLRLFLLFLAALGLLLAALGPLLDVDIDFTRFCEQTTHTHTHTLFFGNSSDSLQTLDW